MSMKVSITNQTEQKLYKRNAIDYTVSYDGAVPSRFMVAQELAKLAKADVSLLVLREQKQSFGRRVVSGVAYAYTDEKDLKAVEQEHFTARTMKSAPKQEEPAQDA